MEAARISAPTLVADGTIDRLDPTTNSRTLPNLIPSHGSVSTPMPATPVSSKTKRPSHV